jgi:glycosyltransferase involved in cell wall biosynthesis
MPVARPNRTWLNEAVASVLGQRGAAVELVIVDDGSEPPVRELLESPEDPLLTIVRTESRGVAHARNAGVAAARGDYVRFADADDVLEPDSTARLLALARDGSIAYGATLVCDEALRPRGVRESDLQGRVEEACLLGGFDVRLPALLFPRDVVEAAGAWDPEFPVCSDWDFVLRALEHAPVSGDGTPAVRYRRHAASLTRTATLEQAEAAWRRVLARYFVRHPDRRGSELERRAERMVALHWARAYAYRGDTRGWLRRFRAGLRADPGPALRELPRLVVTALRAGGRP